MTVEQTVLTIEGRKTEKEEKLFLMLKSICRYQSSQAAQLWNQVPLLDVLMVAERQFRRSGKTFMASSRTVSPDQASAV